ncbi:YqcC family protein [Gilvimarinus sp. DA14]|uniref:YqcC family protein n=1 Tax=Gilvimarinus sp. DA14 TaxID=2956798 RepID=UPI0020B7153C|nr:YqcC family protein [Gilvimarinus sp. DA14]UTF61480.1 YqcC family protein [Gilvimarinus sp. DA14]
MADKHIAVANVLIDIEAAMRELQLWESSPPSAEALASTQPFAIDTLSFTEWLQFIFLPRLQQLVEQRGSLPVNCQIAPMAQEYFRPMAISGEALIIELQRIDTLLSQ